MYWHPEALEGLIGPVAMRVKMLKPVEQRSWRTMMVLVRSIGSASGGYAVCIMPAPPEGLGALLCCGGFPAAPFVSREFYPDLDGIGLCEGRAFELLRALLPFATVGLDALHFAAACFMPAVGWKRRGGAFVSFFAWWAWGLHWEPDEPARFRAAFACAVVFVAVLLVPALRRLARLGESALCAGLYATLATTVFNVLFTGLACSTVDGRLVSGVAVYSWSVSGVAHGGGAHWSRSEMSCVGAGAPLLLGWASFIAAAVFLVACAAAGVLLMPEHLAWPTGVYGHLFDTFVNRTFVSL